MSASHGVRSAGMELANSEAYVNGSMSVRRDWLVVDDTHRLNGKLNIPNMMLHTKDTSYTDRRFGSSLAAGKELPSLVNVVGNLFFSHRNLFDESQKNTRCCQSMLIHRRILLQSGARGFGHQPPTTDFEPTTNPQLRTLLSSSITRPEQVQSF